MKNNKLKLKIVILGRLRFLYLIFSVIPAVQIGF